MENNSVNSDVEYKRDGRRRTERPWGLLLIIIGVVLALKTANVVIFPHWLFSWPMWLIVAGLFFGWKHQFRGGFWPFVLLFGIFSMFDLMNPELHVMRYAWPVVLIGAGLVFVLRPKHHRKSWKLRNEKYLDAVPDYQVDNSEFVDITSVFGGIKKNVLSKSFKGGDITCVMGGCEIDLTQADLQGRAVIDATMFMGGTKLIVPSSWDVQSEITAVFGGVDDKRVIAGVQHDPTKVLVLEGTCVFGGIEIRSF